MPRGDQVIHFPSRHLDTQPLSSSPVTPKPSMESPVEYRLTREQRLVVPSRVTELTASLIETLAARAKEITRRENVARRRLSRARSRRIASVRLNRTSNRESPLLREARNRLTICLYVEQVRGNSLVTRRTSEGTAVTRWFERPAVWVAGPSARLRHSGSRSARGNKAGFFSGACAVREAVPDHCRSGDAA